MYKPVYIYVKRLWNMLWKQKYLFAVIMKRANMPFNNIYDAEWYRNKDPP